MKNTKRLLMALLAVVLALSLAVPSPASADGQLQSAVAGSAAYIYRTVSAPQVGSSGGEWAILGLARSGWAVPEAYYRRYFSAVEDCVTAREGVLDEKKYTEYARVVLALSAIGRDPADVGGYNLLTPLGDFEKTVGQGVNGPVWALIALDCRDYPMPENPDAAVQATRQMYVDELLSRQLHDGGWSLADDGADPDVTAMALQALAKYRDQAAVKAAVDRAVTCLSGMQDENGGFSSGGAASAECAAQVIVALCELDISLDDTRFVKNGNSALDNLLRYRRPDGGFRHTLEESGSNQMSSEQGLYAMAAALRAASGQNSLYRMNDAVRISDGAVPGGAAGLPGKHEAVQAVPVTAPGASFRDIAGSDSRAAIEALAARGIVTGRDNGLFEPEAGMTRAEFAAIITRGLGLPREDTGTFVDVAPDKWYAGYVGTAGKFGIAAGIGGGLFGPGGTITRQEAAVMVARAAGLCGMNTGMSASAIRDTLAQFGDYVTVADWARESAAFCYREGILDRSALNVEPAKPILRCEIAQMLFNLLTSASLM